MDKLKFGNTGMSLTKFGFGGIPVQRLSIKEASSLMIEAFGMGINWIDTANSYGHSEQALGMALNELNRDDIYIFSKAQGDSPDLLKSQIELSMERMQLDHIDLYQFHLVRSLDDWKKKLDNGTVDMMLYFKSIGLVKHIGASAHELEVMLEIMDHPAIEAVQFPFNFIASDIGIKVLEKTRQKGQGFIAMKPFGGGMISEAGPAVRFLMEYPDLVSDPGFEKIEELDEVLNISRGRGLNESDKKRMEKISAELGAKFCRRCGYCSPCPHGVEIVKLMTMDSMLKRLPEHKILGGKNASAAESVKKCVSCGLCETLCPYKLKITERIKVGAELFNNLKNSII